MTTKGKRLELRLRDGSPVVARPLGPADRRQVAEGYRRLSPESRYQRFWVHTGELIGDRMLNRLLHGADQVNHAVWAVVDPSREYPGIGAASYWRSREDPLEAEFSATVLDADQGRGVGTLLLAILWLNGFANGIERFVSHVMPENRKAIRWMVATGAEGEWDGYKVSFHWSLTDPGRLPLTAAGGDLAERLVELTPYFLE
jgi:acetyltransferase